MGIQVKRIYEVPPRPSGERILVASKGRLRLVYAVRDAERNDAGEPAEVSPRGRRASTRRGRS